MKYDTVVAVTGSVGKTTATSLLVAFAATMKPTRNGVRVAQLKDIVRKTLEADPSDRIWIQELSGHDPDALRKAVRLVRPDISIVTSVAFDHIRVLKSQDEIVRSKRQIIESLSQAGIAILNADDERVMSMAAHTQARILTFGASENADIRVLSASSGLPERLRFTVTDGRETAEFQTKLAGERWLLSLLAAIAGARAMDIPLENCRTILESFEPPIYRDSIHDAGGVTFVLDTHKGANASIPSSIDIVKKAKASRKIMIFGTISDYKGQGRPKYQRAARMALDAADQVIFCGPQAERPRRLKPEFPERLHTFLEFEAMFEYLGAVLLPGDLVYLKASGTADHLERIWHAAEAPIACMRMRCGRRYSCNVCDQLWPKGPEQGVSLLPEEPARPADNAEQA